MSKRPVAEEASDALSGSTGNTALDNDVDPSAQPQSGTAAAAASTGHRLSGSGYGSKRRRTESDAGQPSQGRDRNSSTAVPNERFERIWDELSRFDRTPSRLVLGCEIDRDARYGDRRYKYGDLSSSQHHPSDVEAPNEQRGTLTAMEADDWSRLVERGYTWKRFQEYVRRATVPLSSHLAFGPLRLHTQSMYGSPGTASHCFVDGTYIGAALASENVDSNGTAGSTGTFTDEIERFTDIQAHLSGIAGLLATASSKLCMTIESSACLKAMSRIESAFEMLDIRQPPTSLDVASSERLAIHSTVKLTTANLPDDGDAFFRALSDPVRCRIRHLDIEMTRGVPIQYHRFSEGLRQSNSLRRVCIHKLGNGIPQQAWSLLFTSIANSKRIEKVFISDSGSAPDGWLDDFVVLLQSKSIQTLRCSFGDKQLTTVERKVNGERILEALKHNQTITSLLLPKHLVHLKVLYYDIEIVLRLNVMRKRLSPIVVGVADCHNAKLVARLLGWKKVRYNGNMVFEILRLSSHLLARNAPSLQRNEVA